MSKKINVLEIGKEEWENMYDFSKVNFERSSSLTLEKDYQVIFINQKIDEQDLLTLRPSFPFYGTFILKDYEDYYKQFGDLLTKDQIQFIDHDQLKDLIPELYIRYVYGQNASKFDVSMIRAHKSFRGKIELKGNQYVHLDGFFGRDFKQLLYWQYGISITNDHPIDLWLEYVKDENVQLQLLIEEIEAGSVDHIVYEKTFSEQEMDQLITIDHLPVSGSLNFSLNAKGEGHLEIGTLHIRRSRYDTGIMLPGGKRYANKKRQEFFYFYHGGDLKPPLNIYFSGYRTLEGFEGYHMMRSFGAPFLLFSDPRLEGGAFYLGDDEFEGQIFKIIDHYRSLLHFEWNEIIVSGLSMGAFGALYYGCQIHPHAIILGKPLVNLGTMADNETIFRPESFPTSLDLLLSVEGGVAKDDARSLNQRIWEKVKQANLNGVKMPVAYMRNDDYDGKAFSMLVSQFSDQDVLIFGKGIEGRHNDETAAIVNWFVQQYEDLLTDDFNRR